MTRDAASFDRLYREDPDPWDYETSAYEADKYLRCLDLLPRKQYRDALDVGCSTGMFTSFIAARCEHLVGLDFAPTALSRARQRCIPNACFLYANIPRDWPRGVWDLIIVSEVLYYLEPNDLRLVADLIAASLAPKGVCLIVGYTGSTDTVLSAQGVESYLLKRLALAFPLHNLRRDNSSMWVAAGFERY